MSLPRELKVRYSLLYNKLLDEECSKVNGLYTLTSTGKIVHLNLNL